MPRFLRLALLGAALALVTLPVLAVSTLPSPDVARADSTAGRPAREAFRAEMRRLWEEHVGWTRLYIVSAATLDDPLPDLAATAERLFANQDDIGAAIAPFYGQAAAAQLTALLREHISLAAEAIDDAKAGEQAALADALDRWYANADAIAEFLSAANPRNWPLDEARMHMRHHLDLTLQEAVARLNGDYAADIAAYDAIETQILEMADFLSDGIIAQFPGSFGR